MTRYRSRNLSFSASPPWPEPQNLAPDAAPPPMDRRESFVRDAITRFGDDEFFAIDRWNAARRLLVDGDFDGFDEYPSESPRESENRETGGTAPADADDPAAGSSTAAARTLAGWLLTPREAFVPPSENRASYLPHALPIGGGQTISAPYMVTRMTAALNPGPEDAVLEIGTGSGYQAAMLAALSGRVRTVEYVSALAAEAGRTIDRLAKWRPWLRTIRRLTGSGYSGWEDGAPYDRIIVTCAIDHVPPALLDQLAPGGVMVLPLGPSHVQELVAIRRRREGEGRSPGSPWAPAAELPPGFDAADVYGNGTRVMFVPFVH